MTDHYTYIGDPTGTDLEKYTVYRHTKTTVDTVDLENIETLDRTEITKEEFETHRRQHTMQRVFAYGTEEYLGVCCPSVAANFDPMDDHTMMAAIEYDTLVSDRMKENSVRVVQSKPSNYRVGLVTEHDAANAWVTAWHSMIYDPNMDDVRRGARKVAKKLGWC